MTRNHRSSTNSPSKVRTQTKHKGLAVPAKAGATDTNDKFRSFIENLPVLFYAVKPEPPYSPIYVSPAFQIFGYPLEPATAKQKTVAVAYRAPANRAAR